MKRNIQKIAVGGTFLVGVGLWAGFAMQFQADDKLAYDPNPGCIKGSPYGKVLALAMQGPIDFYWHKGQSHEHAATLKAENRKAEECSSGCDDHTHHHKHVHEDHATHAEGCGCGAHGEEAKVVVEAPESPLHTLAKLQIKRMGASAHRKTDGKPLSEAHAKYLQSVTEDKLRLAYDLDPSNYTNYGNLHLFLSTTTYGKSSADDAAAVKLAQQTLDFCKLDEVDPASWITAASAAYNIVYHIGSYHEEFTVAEAKASLAEFDHCMAVFNELLNSAVEEGRIASTERLEELNTRAKYLTKLRQAQGAYMKRMMSTKMAEYNTPQPAN
ncbi:hypothetical protein NT6N_35330 [Oceaniferula spumae]|uniref:Uncharacterized protein n=1 Tax=Oceaniferula spumae TaxID=2979115 RepID=A0AAT9FR88_9BACT